MSRPRSPLTFSETGEELRKKSHAVRAPRARRQGEATKLRAACSILESMEAIKPNKTCSNTDRVMPLAWKKPKHELALLFNDNCLVALSEALRRPDAPKMSYRGWDLRAGMIKAIAPPFSGAPMHEKGWRDLPLEIALPRTKLVELVSAYLAQTKLPPRTIDALVTALEQGTQFYAISGDENDG